ncbi:glycoside hydrolase family 76 protein [Bipolaris oryzae ATCC 44560]|uniref:Glycoside hydrolase family 76 protein n=1 Tax=Bipolaris oryzae ATCC 44560 TaxID=930090 RepID=W6ZI74_COCMI|nr:glycoside hydrolase family 76 protein [Bipolaris oryzae ATCC 44560]EUC43201.1 glycoside hydrolase family 76 protein [Bipolaris oryzae ATCC 44560]
MRYLQVLLLPVAFFSFTCADFTDDAIASIQTLQKTWYNFNTGLWDDFWWQSGNILEAIAQFGIEDPDFKDVAANIVANTYAKSPDQHGAKQWTNKFYDDMGWWAMAWIASYDLTGDKKYLNSAKSIFQDMTSGWNTPCGGGIWWSEDRDYIAAIANELFLAVAAHLANRCSGQERLDYLNWADREWEWFSNSGLINSDGLINDGIDPATCKNNGGTTFTYNQGIILAGLSELSRAKSDPSLVDRAYDIFNAVSKHLTDPSGILTEPVSGALDPVASQFKGAFGRGLLTLYQYKPRKEVKQFFMINANAARSARKGNGGVIPGRWQGDSSDGNTCTLASGIDILVAAAYAEKH